MGRRRKISIKKRTRKKKQRDIPIRKKRMLDMGSTNSFKYKLRQTLDDVEGGEPIFANINSKSINIGISEAKNYVEDTFKQGSITRKKADEIIELLDRFTKFR
jgi:hypothetical protein